MRQEATAPGPIEEGPRSGDATRAEPLYLDWRCRRENI